MQELWNINYCTGSPGRWRVFFIQKQNGDNTNLVSLLGWKICRQPSYTIYVILQSEDFDKRF